MRGFDNLQEEEAILPIDDAGMEQNLPIYMAPNPKFWQPHDNNHRENLKSHE
jgi:hypothetical protein